MKTTGTTITFVPSFNVAGSYVTVSLPVDVMVINAPISCAFAVVPTPVVPVALHLLDFNFKFEFKSPLVNVYSVYSDNAAAQSLVAVPAWLSAAGVNVIVVAILAILVGLLAPQYTKYVEKSRKSADANNLEELVKSF